MLIKRPDDIKSSEITDKDLFLNRRRFLIGGSALAAGAALAGLGVGALLTGPAGATSPRRLQNIQPGQFKTDEELTPERLATTYTNFYEFSTDKDETARLAKNFKTDPWTVSVEGEVGKPGKYQLEDFMAPYQLEERVYRFRCVETWSMVVPWVGFSLAKMIKRFEPTSKAKYVEFTTLYDPERMPGQRRHVLDWPYVEGLRMDEAMHPLAILAVGLYGDVLPNQNGAPLRLIVPWKYGFKNVKSIVKIRFTEHQPVTTWAKMAPDEYGFFANVNPAVDHPRWSQAKERRLGEFRKRETLPFNGYAEQVAGLYSSMDLRRFF